MLDVIMLMASIVLTMVFAVSLLFRKGSFEVIKALRAKEALDPSRARHSFELGMTPQSVAEKMYSTPDYKPFAMHYLVSKNIIIFTEDGQFYLSEEALKKERERSNLARIVLPRN